MISSTLCSILSLVIPAQNELKLELPKQSPPTFALAKVSQDGKSIAVTQSAGGSQGQTYTVAVPVTRVIKDADGKGKTVTEMVMQTRTRTVPVQRAVTQTYTVMVSVTKEVAQEDGTTRNVTVLVPEKRTRTVLVSGGGGSGKPKLHQIAKCRFTDLAGKPLGPAEVASRLKSKSPIALMRNGQQLDPFYRVALNAKMMLVTLPVPKPVNGNGAEADDGGWKPFNGGGQAAGGFGDGFEKKDDK